MNHMARCRSFRTVVPGIVLVAVVSASLGMPAHLDEYKARAIVVGPGAK